LEPKSAPYRLIIVGIRSVFCGVAAVMLVVACGDPASVRPNDEGVVAAIDPAVVESLPDASSAAPSSDVQVCTDAPFGGSPVSAQPLETDSLAVNQWVEAHPDLFSGVWWDGSLGQWVFASVDVDQSSVLIAQELRTDLDYRVEHVPHSASELAVLQQRVGTLAEQGTEASSGQRVWDALLEIDLPILDEPSLNAVREVFGDNLDAICVTGADPATVPPDGPQPTSGGGWRLVTDQTQHGEPYSVNVAVNAIEYESLWASLALDGTPPSVDFATEIVIDFGAVYSGTCPEIRLDDVHIDVDRSVVTADIVQLGGNRACTADANPRTYLVAVDKAKLPALPFTVSLSSECLHCDHVDVTSLDGTLSPVAALSEFDRAEILAAATVARLDSEGSMFDTVDVIEVVGHATADSFVNFDDPVALTEAERNTIIQALGSRSVRFVPAAFDQLVAAPGYAVISLAEPVVLNGQLTITTALWCGNVCGPGGANAVERRDDATWKIADPVGPQWVA
jgi:hypothetical protein